ncbi:MAG: NUDIX hydrolase, partial [Chloroflexi bacterium]|nr:NUDIX hydrolase [Chloroflexota bacterium]
ALEEAGYRLETLEPLGACYLSPGACTERIHLYLAPISPAQRVAAGGGLPGTGENIRVCALPLAEALAMVTDGRIRDAKTIIALQHLALRAGLAAQGGVR